MAISRRGFIRVLGTSAVILAGGGYAVSRVDRMPEEAIEGWKGPGPGLQDPRVRAISYALLPPNPHNMQPWLVDLREPRTADLYCDRTRLLPQTDPYSRQIVIGCGAFLELLRMAAAEQGMRLEITLFPKGEWADGEVGEAPLCRIGFVPDAGTARDGLFAQVAKRRTARLPFAKERPVGNAAGAALLAEAGAGVSTGFTSEPTAAARLRDIGERAWLVEANTERTYLESVNVYRIGAGEIAEHRDGLSFHGPMMWGLKTLGLFTQESARRPGSLAHQGAIDSYVDWVRNTWSFGWLTTAANRRADQIATGRAYVRINLKATEMGIAMHPVSQALQEFAEMAAEMRNFHEAIEIHSGHTAQMFFRLGYAGPVDPSPRRSLDVVIRS